METKHYPNTGIPASSLGEVRTYVNRSNSRSLGDGWAHKVSWYKLHYPDHVVDCASFDNVRKVVAERGETIRHETYFESRTGRKLHLVATDPTNITLTVENGRRTEAMLRRVEEIMSLTPYVQRVFLTHGQSPVWREVQDFIEQECTPRLETIEMASRPNQGRTLIEKLEAAAADASYAVVVMTGDDAAEDEVRARENVLHEIGYFQGQYGRQRVCLLREDDVNIPTNLSGMGYSGFPKGRVTAAFIELQRELKAAFPNT